MNAHLMPALCRSVTFLRDAAQAPRAQWPSVTRAVRDLPRVGLDAGETAMRVDASAKSLVRQLPDLRANAEGPARALLAALADILQTELDARFEPPAGEEVPWHLRGEK